MSRAGSTSRVLNTPCRATRRDGQPCGGLALPSGPYCWAHEPGLAEERRLARVKGGKASASRVRLARLMPARLIPVWEKLETALEEVHEGTLDARQASAMAALAGALVRVLQTGEMEERLRRLEAQESGRYDGHR